MVDVAHVAGSPLERQPGSGATGYGKGRAVERVAAVTASRYAPETLEQMRRLADFIASGRQFRDDVPPGFYFNARV